MSDFQGLYEAIAALGHSLGHIKWRHILPDTKVCVGFTTDLGNPGVKITPLEKGTDTSVSVEPFPNRTGVALVHITQANGAALYESGQAHGFHLRFVGIVNPTRIPGHVKLKDTRSLDEQEQQLRILFGSDWPPTLCVDLLNAIDPAFVGTVAAIGSELFKKCYKNTREFNIATKQLLVLEKSGKYAEIRELFPALQNHSNEKMHAIMTSLRNLARRLRTQ